MNIFFFKFPLEDSLGGAEFHTLQLAKHFQKQGHKVKLLTSDTKLFRLFEQNHIPRKRIFCGWEPTSKWSLLLWPLTALIARIKLKKVIKNAPPDSVFFCQSLTEKLILPSLLKPITYNLKPIFLEHKIPGRWLTQNPLRYRYTVFANSTIVVTVSEFAKKQFVKFGISEKNIKVIHPGISPKTYNLKPKTFFAIGLLSRLSPEKGVLDFLQTISPYLSRYPHWRVTVAGEGRQKPEIEQLAQKYSQIKLLGFIYNPGEFFSQISVLAYPTKVPESFGISVLEAQSRGIPVVASKIGALPEIIQHNETGFLIPSPRDGEGKGEIVWTKYLESLQNPEIYKKMSITAHKTSQKFSSHKMLSEFDRVIE